MSPTKTRKLFVNVSVKELRRTKAFFSELGFSFDPKFTDEKAACMILSTDAWVMLLETDAAIHGRSRRAAGVASLRRPRGRLARLLGTAWSRPRLATSASRRTTSAMS